MKAPPLAGVKQLSQEDTPCWSTNCLSLHLPTDAPLCFALLSGSLVVVLSKGGLPTD